MKCPICSYGNPHRHWRPRVNVRCPRVEFLQKTYCQSCGDIRDVSGMYQDWVRLVYLTKVHRFNTFTSKRRTDGWTRSGLSSSHDELNNLVSGCCCACFRHLVPAQVEKRVRRLRVDKCEVVNTCRSLQTIISKFRETKKGTPIMFEHQPHT